MSSVGERKPKQPEEATWQEWVDLYLPRLALFARQQTRSDSDAEDVLQDAIIESWRRSDGQCPDLPLVFANIRRRAIDLGRRLQVRKDFAEGTDIRLNWVETDFEGLDEARLLRKLLGELKTDFHDVVTLKIWGGLTFTEIGEVCSISPNTASSRYRLALQKLNQSLTPLIK